jgi:hypothetical protein
MADASLKGKERPEVPVPGRVYRATIVAAMLLISVALTVAWWTVRPAQGDSIRR